LSFDLCYKYTEYQQDSVVNKCLNEQQMDAFFYYGVWWVVARSDGLAMLRAAFITTNFSAYK
jgi:hypothetical protein